MFSARTRKMGRTLKVCFSQYNNGKQMTFSSKITVNLRGRTHAYYAFSCVMPGSKLTWMNELHFLWKKLSSHKRADVLGFHIISYGRLGHCKFPPHFLIIL